MPVTFYIVGQSPAFTAVTGACVCVCTCVHACLILINCLNLSEPWPLHTWMLVSIMSQSICVTGDNYCNKARGECFSNSESLLQEAKEASLQLLSSLDAVMALNSFLGFGKHTENQKGIGIWKVRKRERGWGMMWGRGESPGRVLYWPLSLGLKVECLLWSHVFESWSPFGTLVL